MSLRRGVGFGDGYEVVNAEAVLHCGFSGHGCLVEDGAEKTTFICR